MNKNEQYTSLDGDLPRYILEPFEIIGSSDPRYETAYTYSEIISMNESSEKND